MAENAHIFWDNSNIYIAAKYAAERADGLAAWNAVRIHFENIYRLASAGRRVGKAICVGSVPPELRAVWERLRKTGVQVETFERGKASGTEQGIDQCLQVHMLRSLADEREPGIAVLLTGDGAGYQSGAGFHADLERLYKNGWGIEVISWGKVCAKALKEWAASVGAFIPLDDYYQAVTFVEGGRRAGHLSLKNRRYARPSAKAASNPVGD